MKPWCAERSDSAKDNDAYKDKGDHALHVSGVTFEAES